MCSGLILTKGAIPASQLKQHAAQWQALDYYTAQKAYDLVYGYQTSLPTSDFQSRALGVIQLLAMLVRCGAPDESLAFGPPWSPSPELGDLQFFTTSICNFFPLFPGI